MNLSKFSLGTANFAKIYGVKNANSYSSSCLSLSIFYGLSIKQAKYIVTTVKLMVKNYKKQLLTV
jgi:dTDP-4-amino-4,6-dideoxygalactose transaminase|tara:strand:+ start:1407 stop:1601 length:195 start_codon:yes stop_codon:yes gene_type:complete